MSAYARTLSARVHRAVTDVVGSAIGFFSPAAACRYFRGRSQLYTVRKRGYEAGQTGGSNSNWRVTNKSADAEIRRDGDRVRARARDLVRNDSRIKGAVATVANNVVRTGIWPQAAFKTRSGEANKILCASVEKLWHSWAPRADASGAGSLYALQRLGLAHLFQDGEFLVHEVWDRRFPVLPLRFELIEADQLDASVDGQLKNGNIARRGVEFGRHGQVEAYWVLPYHPGDSGMYTQRGVGVSERIPATSCKLIFHRERISQTRGVAWLASVALRAFNLTEYDDYEMIGAKLAAAFGVFFTQSPVGGMDAFSQPGAQSGPMPEYIDPGMMRTLPPGAGVEIAEHNRPGNNYADFQAANQQAVAAGLGMSYESLSKDFSRSTYSSARQGILEERTGYRVMQDFLCEQLLSWIWERFLLAAQLSGKVTLPGFDGEPERYVDAVVWQTPGWTWIDPSKDAKASQARVDMGISSRTREAREQGADFEESIAEQIREEEQLLALAKIRAERRALEKPAESNPPAKQKEAASASA